MQPKAKPLEVTIRFFCLASFFFAILIISIFSADDALAGSISGRVTDKATGAPVAAMKMEIMDSYLDYRASAAANLNGDYTFDNLPSGQYLVRASTEDSGYVALFYKSALNYYRATLIYLDDSDALSGIDMQLEKGQGISGRITDQDTNLPVCGIMVYALHEETLVYPWHEIWEDTNMMASCFGYGGICKTDMTGHYSIKAVPPGRYIVGAEAIHENTNPYITEYFGECFSPFLATIVPVTETKGSENIDISLETGGVIRGAVTYPNGAGVEGVMVIAERMVSWIYGIDESDIMMKARTDPNGRYRITGLPPGNYRVYIGRYAMNPYPASIPGLDPYQSLTVKIAKGMEIENCCFVIASPPGRITGTIRSASDGSPVRGISVSIVSYNEYSYSYFPYQSYAFYGYGGDFRNGYFMAKSFTGASGQYTLSSLGSGTYLVDVSANSFLRGDVSEFIGQTYGISGRDAYTSILPPEEASGIDFYLSRGGSISGTVRDASDGTPVAGIQVNVCNRPLYGVKRTMRYSSFTDSEGIYRIEGLDRSPYIVYIGEYPDSIMYSGSYPSTFFASGGYIDVSGPRSTTSYRFDDYSYLGSYIPENYKGNYWHVCVSPPEDIKGIDFDLVMGGSVSGFVYSQESGKPISTAEVRAIKLGVYPYNTYSVRADANGFYSLTGLHKGEYQLEAIDRKLRYLQSDIRLVSVKESDTLTDQNFSLKPGGSITGVITDETTGLPIPNVVVCALKFYEYETYPYPVPGSYSEPDGGFEYYDYYSPALQGFSFPYAQYSGYTGPYGGLWNKGVWNPCIFPVTDEEGRYTITGLPSGEYRVSCIDLDGMYMSGHYPDIPGIPFIDIMDEAFIRLEKDICTGSEGHPFFQARYQTLYPLEIHLLLRDKNGIDVPAVIRLGAQNILIDGIYLGYEGCFASSIGSRGVIKSGHTTDSWRWGILEVNLEDLLAKYFSSSCYDGDQGTASSGMDSVIRICLEGNGYSMDYIRLADKSEGGQISHVYIEGFNYNDHPAAHGWQVTSAKAPYITMLSGDYLEGGGGMRALAETPVMVNEGNQTYGVDMAMASAGGGQVSGTVTDARDGHTVSGMCIDILRIDYQSGSGCGAYETVTDTNGEYLMEGIDNGVYAVLARHKNNGPYLPQWYGEIQTPLNVYNLNVYPYSHNTYSYTNDFLSVCLKREGLTSFTNHQLEFMTRTSSSFTISANVLTSTGRQVRIKFCRAGEYGVSGKKTIISDTILVPLSDDSYSKGLWARFRYDLNGILKEQLSAQLGYVQGIEIRGGLYLIDDIRLTQEGMEDQVIDTFDYQDSPLNHGWVSDSAAWFESIQDNDIGRSCILVASVSPVKVQKGEKTEGIDFSMRPAGGISGAVFDVKDGHPMSGVNLHAFANHPGLVEYEYYSLPYYYASGVLIGGSTGTLSNADGSYTITGLLPGKYRVQSIDLNNSFASFVYQDIPMKYVPVCMGGVILTRYASGNLTSLEKDLDQLDITNPKLHVDMIFHDSFALRVKVEATDGSVVGLDFHTGYRYYGDWYKDADENPNIPAFSVNLGHETEYNGHRLEEGKWETWEVCLDEIVNSEFSITFKRVKDIRITGNGYRIASIRFLKEGEADQSADGFDYQDSPLNHGWTTSRSWTTNPVMIWDEIIERMTLDCSPAKLVTVEEGKITPGIIFQLLSSNRVTGRVTNTADGSPLSGIHVYTQNIDSSSESFTDTNGRYTLYIPGLPDVESYKINADDWGKRIYAKTSYPLPLKLDLGMEAENIDMAMEVGTRVTGRVTYSSTNEPVAGAFVECLVPDLPYNTNPKTIHSVRTDPNGNYCMTGISEGGYVIYAMSDDFKQEGYYMDNRDLLDPPVICGYGEEKAGIDIRLKPIERPIEGEDGVYSMPYWVVSYYPMPSIYETLWWGSTTLGINYNFPSSMNPIIWEDPNITSMPEKYASVGMTYTYNISIDDPDQWGDIHCYLIDAPSGMTFDSGICQITWTPSLYQVGVHAVEVNIHVPKAGIAVQSFTINVLPYMVIESAEGDKSPLLNGEWGILQGSGAFADANDNRLESMVLSTQTNEADPLDFRIGYPLSYPLENPRPYLSFAIQSDQDFRFCVSVHAGGQDYFIQYAPAECNFAVYGNTVVYPLGSEYLNGQWRLCMRDLQEDLAPFGVVFEWVSHFEIWGMCCMDDLWLSYQPVDYRIFSVRLDEGLNLVSLPLKAEDMNSFKLAELCTESCSRIRKRNGFLQRWETGFGSLREDQGLVIYSDQEKWITFKGTQKEMDIETISASMKPGINLFSPPHPHEKGCKARDLLNGLKASGHHVQGVQMFDRRKGAWLSVSPFFNSAAGASFDVRQDESYLCHIE
ncbi:carboxypeptidase regulatory-like domain-containing protein [bacterium]|nr:carboxypeptidase regulatory-like domain-containing protein [bacterium]